MDLRKNTNAVHESNRSILVCFRTKESGKPWDEATVKQCEGCATAVYVSRIPVDLAKARPKNRALRMKLLCLECAHPAFEGYTGQMH